MADARSLLLIVLVSRQGGEPAYSYSLAPHLFSALSCCILPGSRWRRLRPQAVHWAGWRHCAAAVCQSYSEIPTGRDIMRVSTHA